MQSGMVYNVYVMKDLMLLDYNVYVKELSRIINVINVLISQIHNGDMECVDVNKDILIKEVNVLEIELEMILLKIVM